MIQYFFERIRFQITLFIAFIALSGIIWLKQPGFIYASSIYLGFILYIGLLYYLIASRSKTIYQNTKFFHNTQHISFDSEKISGEFPKPFSIALQKIKIMPRKSGIILFLSHFHIIPIPYKCITKENWEYLYNLSQTNKNIKISNKKYNKFNQQQKR